jgi:hypothetical protein
VEKSQPASLYVGTPQRLFAFALEYHFPIVAFTSASIFAAPYTLVTLGQNVSPMLLLLWPGLVTGLGFTAKSFPMVRRGGILAGLGFGRSQYV